MCGLQLTMVALAWHTPPLKVPLGVVLECFKSLAQTVQVLHTYDDA